jgi:N4-gp56 family major capsid protein
MYAPTPNTTGNADLAHLATVWYNRRALSTKRKHTHFWRAGKPDDLPLQNGKTVQWFRPTEFGANTTVTTEGSPGTSLSEASSTLSATVSFYADFITLSDFLIQTDIINSLEMATDRLSYRGALSVDAVIRAELDASSTDQPLIGDVISAFDLAKTRFLNAGSDIQPWDNGYIRGFFHPYVLYDLMNDPQAGGFQDLSKHIDELKSKNIKVPDRGYMGRIHNVEIWETSNALQVTAGPPSTYRSYLTAHEGLGIVRLAGKGPKFVSDPDKERFNVKIGRNDGNQVADPEGKIAAWVSYNFKFVPKTLDATRLTKIDSSSSIVA